MSTTMDCVVCRPKLDALIDGELTSEEIDFVRAHLAVCADCARTLESRSDLSRLLRENLVHYTAPDVLKARIRSALSQSTAQAAGDRARVSATASVGATCRGGDRDRGCQQRGHNRSRACDRDGSLTRE